MSHVSEVARARGKRKPERISRRFETRSERRAGDTSEVLRGALAFFKCFSLCLFFCFCFSYFWCFVFLLFFVVFGFAVVVVVSPLVATRYTDGFAHAFLGTQCPKKRVDEAVPTRIRAPPAEAASKQKKLLDSTKHRPDQSAQSLRLS